MRVPYWNIKYGFIIDLLAIPVIAIFIYGIYKHWKNIKNGKERIKIKNIPADIPKIGPIYTRPFVILGILGARLYRKLFTGIAHGFLFWGMFLLAIGTLLVFSNVILGIPVFKGFFNKFFMGFLLDLAGFLAIIGIVFFIVRRKFFPPERLTAIKERKDFLIGEGILAFILITGFLLEGTRISLTGPDPGSFIGNCISAIIGKPGLGVYKFLWWLHGLAALSFIAYIPFSPFVHIVLAPANTGLSTPLPGVKMGVVDIDIEEIEEEEEEELVLGVEKLKDFSWKRLLDFSTCLWCGRCHEVCPAALTGKELSPKRVIVTLAELVKNEKFEDSIFESIPSSVIYSCTTCAACLEACPVSINQPKAILRMRQNLLMEKSEIPEIMGRAYKSLENRGHPFFGTGFGKKDWCKGIDVPLFKKNETEYLLWIGCSIAYEERTQAIGRAMVNILKKAGISFGVLPEIRCTGDPAKQMGSEFLFTELAKENIELLNSLGVKKIITLCPHCYTSFVQYYPELGGEYEVIPHVVMIKRLIDSGAISVKQQSGKKTKITYHDPCYLGRHNRIFDEPREIISIMGELVEMKRNREFSFCCGGGGGNYWSEEEGTRINRERAREAFETGAEIITTSCPFCVLMLTDGLKGFTQEKKVFEISELVEENLIE